MLGYDDKRNFFRMMVNSPCQLQITDDESSRTMQAMCRDISATGMSLEVDEPSGLPLDRYIIWRAYSWRLVLVHGPVHRATGFIRSKWSRSA